MEENENMTDEEEIIISTEMQVETTVTSSSLSSPGSGCEPVSVSETVSVSASASETVSVSASASASEPVSGCVFEPAPPASPAPDSTPAPDLELNENAKRFKTDADDTTNPSTSNQFPRATNSRSRNYRKPSATDNQECEDADDEAGESIAIAELTANLEEEEEDPSVERRHRNLWYMNFEASNSSSSDSFSREHEHDHDEDHESASTVLNDSDSDSVDVEDPAVLTKQKPKHTWFMVPEVINRQIGAGSKYQSSDLFQRRCYGSLHSVQRLELMYKLEKHEGCVNSLNFHPNGKLLASGSDDLQCVIWDWPVGRPLVSFDTKHKGNVFQSRFLDLSGDLHIVTSSRDGQVRLHQVSAMEGVRSTRRLSSHRAPVHKLAVLHDQPHVVLSCGEDGCVYSHDIRDSKSSKLLTVQSMDDRKIALYSISSHPLDSHQFCVSGRDHIVRIYDQRKLSPVLNTFFPGHVKKKSDVMGLHVTCAMYNYNGTEILASYCDDDIFLFDTSSTTNSYVHCYQGHRNGATIKGVNFFGPKSEYIVSGSDCGNVFFWDKNTEAIVQFMLADDSGVVNALEPHPQLPIICTSGLDWDVKVWVPSHEHEPEMANLASTVRRNNRCRITERIHSSTDINDSQMLWMLWRHLRTTERLQRYSRHGGAGDDTEASRSAAEAELTLSEASSNSNADSSEPDDDLVRPLSCSPS